MIGIRFVSASESHVYSVSRDSRNETPQHYAGTDCLAEKLALSGKIKYSYGNLIDGYCVINSVQKRIFILWIVNLMNLNLECILVIK